MSQLQLKKTEILRMHAQGRTCPEISKKVSIHRDSIRKFLNRQGFKVNLVSAPAPCLTVPPAPPALPEKLNRNSEPMRSGHPTAINALWKGLEHWRPAIQRGCIA